MKEIPIPELQSERLRGLFSLKRKYTALYVLFYVAIALAFACLVALLVTSLILELNGGDPVLFFSLIGAFAGGTVLFGGSCLLFARLSDRFADAFTDFSERCEGEECFTVGEGTLVNFGGEGLSFSNGDTHIDVPYAEVTFFSVCSRHAPRERGEWSVAIQVPARYFAKKPEKDAPPLLIQADAKERMLRAIEAHGLRLFGEKREEGKGKGKFRKIKSFSLPNPKGRKEACIRMGLGAVLAAGGIPLAVFNNVTAGAFLSAVGVLILMSGIRKFVSAKRSVVLYEEGLHLREENIADRMFLKWEEIVSLSQEEDVLRVRTAYGACEYPAPAGAFDYLKEHFPGKCREA